MTSLVGTPYHCLRAILRELHVMAAGVYLRFWAGYYAATQCAPGMRSRGFSNRLSAAEACATRLAADVL